MTNNYKREMAYFFCSSYRKNSEVCSAHYIREAAVAKNVLASMQRVFAFVQLYEKRFAEAQMEKYGEEQKKVLVEKRKAITKAKKRIAEIDGLIQKIYEDNANGKLSDERYSTMSMNYENEQRHLKEETEEAERSLNEMDDREANLQSFIGKVQKITQLTELSAELVHEFIEKIIVHAPRYLDGERYQIVDIYYNGIGVIQGFTPEDMEEAFQERLKQMQNKSKMA